MKAYPPPPPPPTSTDTLKATLTTFSEFTFGDALEDQQLGCLWQGDHLLTVSLSGNINFLDTNNPSCPKRIIKVIALTLS